jgi:protein-tyrosine phosphatase
MANKSPLDISPITSYLYISAFPLKHHVQAIQALNVRLILSMHWVRPSLEIVASPIRLLWLPTMDTPVTPMPIFFLRRGVEAALPVIQDGGSVMVHCKAGVHRSVAMACCVLIGMGYSANEAMDRVVEQRPVADPHIWYLEPRIYKFEQVWRARN